MEPLPCHPSSLPKYPPSKEFDAKIRGEEARRQKAEAVKGRGPESVRRGSLNKAVPTPEFSAQAEMSLQEQSNPKSYNQNPQVGGGRGFLIEQPRASQSAYSHSNTIIHPRVAESSWVDSVGSITNSSESRTLRNNMPQAAADLSNSCFKMGERMSGKESTMGYVPNRNRMHHSGPLVTSGGNIEEMLKEHERQIQQAVRKARGDKSWTNTSYNDNGKLHYQRINV